MIDHYSDNPISDPNLGYAIPVGPLKFTASEKAALIAFLKTLTDRRSLTDPRFSNPFVDQKDALKSVKRTVLTAGAMLMAVGAATPQPPVVLRPASVAGFPPGEYSVEVFLDGTSVGTKTFKVQGDL